MDHGFVSDQIFGPPMDNFNLAHLFPDIPAMAKNQTIPSQARSKG